MKKIAYIAVVIGLCLVINSLLHSIYNLWHKQDLLILAEKQLIFEEKKNKELKARYQYAKTQDFIEEEAHNKLFMVREGEQKVLITGLKSTQINPRSNSNMANWEQWLSLFF
jgi:cell division protein FtsB